MYKGKRLMKQKTRRRNKSAAMLVSVLLLIGITVGGTAAYLVTSGTPVKNIFTPSKVTTYVDEDVTTVSGTKKNVKIQNTGNTTAYIRAAVVFTWQDAQGNVLGQKPVKGTDYALTDNVSTTQQANCWIKGGDGFFYWTSPVKSETEDSTDCTTGVLIQECKALQTKTVGGITYSLAVEIISSGIQSVPTTVVVEEWDSGVSSVSDDGILTIKTINQ